MAYTEQDRDRLKAAIASGVLTVTYSDRGSVTYRDFNHLLRALTLVEAELATGVGTLRTRRVVLTNRSGF